MRTGGPGESALLLLDVVAVLNERQIPYAVIGAIAATIHGVMRASMDADLVVSLPFAKAVELEQALIARGFATELSRGDYADPIPGMLKASDSHENRVDLLVGLRGLEPQAFSRAIDVPFQGSSLRFIGAEDFIAMKLFAGGPVDMLDATRALVANSKEIDRELLRRIAAGYDVDTARNLEKLFTQEP
jgi:predicted nucleotidyltransferase